MIVTGERSQPNGPTEADTGADDRRSAGAGFDTAKWSEWCECPLCQMRRISDADDR